MGLRGARARRPRGKVLDRRIQMIRIQGTMLREMLAPGRHLMLTRTGAIGKILEFRNGELVVRWN